MKVDYLGRAKVFEASFSDWYDSELKHKLDDNRRRYRMILEDEEERKKRGLSCLPSAKSTAAVDRAVESALFEYHLDPRALSYVAKREFEPNAAMTAKWLTEVVKLRMDFPYFPFFSWHLASMKSGFVDGLEAAMVWWKKEAYSEKVTRYHDLLAGQEIDEETYSVGADLDPMRFHKESADEQVTVADTWWIDQLRPGENLLWDLKIPYMDINLGQAALVKVFRTIDEIVSMSENGVFDKVSRDELEQYRSDKLNNADNKFHSTSFSNGLAPDESDMGEMNRIEVWYYFEKVENCWKVQFSIEGNIQLSKLQKVNDVFFGGRQVDRLPIVLGTCNLDLWQTTGRGIPQVIGPIEDEYSDHRNAMNDLAKLAVQGKWRMNPDSDTAIDDILNGRIVKAYAGEIEPIAMNFGVMENLRATDQLTADMTELVPAGMQSQQVVPKGTDKTLGAVQMAMQGSHQKQAVQLMIRNQTFLKPLLWLIAQLEFAFETDEVALRIGAVNAGIQPPMTFVDGKPGVDISRFDFDADVQINTGMGSYSPQQKVNNMLQLMDMGMKLGVPLNNQALFTQMSVWAGFAPEQFISQTPPPPKPPEVDYKLTLNADLVGLMGIAPEIVQDLRKKYALGQVSATTNVDGQIKKALNNSRQGNGTGPQKDMVNTPQAMAQSQGGQQNGNQARNMGGMA